MFCLNFIYQQCFTKFRYILLIICIFWLCKIVIIAKYLNIQEFRYRFYIKSAFRVNDNLIRLSIVKSHLNKFPLYFRYGTKNGRIKLICHQHKCPHEYSPPCELTGYIGIIDNIDVTDNSDNIHVFSTVSNNFTTQLSVIDVRQKLKPNNNNNNEERYGHQLGVCVLPIYLMTDYTLLIQFFEYWINEKATKFFIYWESISEEIRDILNFYIKTSGITIELIDWSLLPLTSEGSKNNTKTNPNAFWYRLEGFLSIFDCLHRARYNTKFIAQSDLDEIFYVQNGTKLLDYLESKNRDYSNMGALEILSKRVHLNERIIRTIENPSQFNFGIFNNLTIDSQPFKKPVYTKIIYRPERSFRAHIHVPIASEKSSDKHGKYYEYISVPSEEITVWHFRRIKDVFKVKNTMQTTELMNTAKIWESNFDKRLKTDILAKRQKWNNFNETFASNFEKCRQNQSKNQLKICHNLFYCESKNAVKNKWIRAKNSWTFI